MHTVKKERFQRGWVKNVAIVFLLIMLGLTFFSKTIMNASLTEVSGQYMQSGSISTAVTGYGTVSANVAYHVQLESTRTVKEVLIAVGDTVVVGQTLFVLEDAESTELVEAEKTLSDLQYAYNQLLITNIGKSYASENQNIQHLRDDLADAIENREQIAEIETAYTSAKDAAEAAQSRVDELNNTVTDLQGQITLATADDETINALNEQLAVAQEEQSAAEAALANCQAETADLQANMTMSLTEAESVLIQAQQTLEAEQLELSYKQMDYETLVADQDANSAAVTEAQRELERQELTVESQKSSVVSAQEQFDLVSAQTAELAAAQTTESEAQAVLDDKKTAVTELQKAIENQKIALTEELSLQLTTVQAELASAQSRLLQAQSNLSAASSNYTTSVEAADANIKTLRQNLESALAALSEQQITDGVAAQTADLELEQAKKAMEAQEEVVDKIRQEGLSNEVTALYDGTVSEVNVIAGDITTEGQSLASINVDGKEYSMTVTVTQEQSQKVSVGDEATVTNFLYGNITAVVTGIKNDPDNPGKNKLLELTVSGDVVDGQSLNISVGTKTENYDTVVSKSALYEDSNGEFVLVAEAKSTPLGTRYTATRVPVIVEASDAFNAAIDTGGIEGAYVITTSTAPIADGEQIRLTSQ